MLTQEKLKEQYHYDSDTGTFTRKRSNIRGLRASIPVGTINSKNYLIISIDVGGCRKPYLAHRLAWLYVYGAFPDGLLDHINRNKLDNRIANLRIATKEQNQWNRTAIKNSKSGVKGVTWHQKSQKWQTHVRANGVIHYLGLYATIEEAKCIVDAKRLELHKKFVNND